MKLSPALIDLWVYIVLLIVGGLVGFLKAGSKISLVMSVLFAVPLILCALNVFPLLPVAPILLGLLVVVFGIRFAKGRKFMPSGLMLLLSLETLIFLLVLR